MIKHRGKNPKVSPKKVAALPRPSQGLTKGAAPADHVREAEVSTLVRDLGAMIEGARSQVAVAANVTLTTLYWQIGHRVRTEVLDERRAAYGVQIVATVSQQLEARYGRGFNEKSLRRMVQFATAFPDAQIVATLSRQSALVALRRSRPDQGFPEARFLCRDVQGQRLYVLAASPLTDARGVE